MKTKSIARSVGGIAVAAALLSGVAARGTGIDSLYKLPDDNVQKTNLFWVSPETHKLIRTKIDELELQRADLAVKRNKNDQNVNDQIENIRRTELLLRIEKVELETDTEDLERFANQFDHNTIPEINDKIYYSHPLTILMLGGLLGGISATGFIKRKK